MKKPSKEKSEEILKVLKDNFVNYYRIIFELDQKAGDHFKSRNIHFYHQKHEHSHDSSNGNCCSKYYSEICIPQKELTKLELLVQERLSNIKLVYDLPEILDSLANSYFNIQKNGKADSLNWNEEAEKFVLNEVLKEGILRQMVKILKKEMISEQNVDAKQPLLLATPNSWKEKFPKIELNFLSSNSLANLRDHKFMQQKGFLKFPGFQESLLKELNFLERDSRFEECIQEGNTRNDRVLWLSLSDIPDGEFQFLKQCLTSLCAIPFELNAKANLGVQTSEQFQISYFKADGHHSKHLDSTYDKNNQSGKKFTGLYIVNKFEGSNLTLFNSEGGKLESLKLTRSSLILLHSRDIPYSIKTKGKGFIVRFWINGPF